MSGILISPTLDSDGVTIDVEDDAAPVEDPLVEIGVHLCEPAQHRPHPREQLAGGVRLRDVVVGAELEPDHDVHLGVLGREHDDRHSGGRPHLPAHLGSRHPGKHEIQQDDVGTALTEGHERSGSVFGDLDLVGLPAQQVREGVGEIGLVLDDQDACHAGSPFVGTARGAGADFARFLPRLRLGVG